MLGDLTVMKELADRLGRGRLFSGDPREIFEELRRASAGGIADYAGISWERIEQEKGVFWPCPIGDHPGTPRLFAESFPTADGKAAFVRVEHRDPAEGPDADFPYVLTTGRLMAQYQSGTQTRRHRALAQTEVQPEVQLHPDLARRARTSATADIVELTSRRGSATFRAKITDEIRPDTVFLPFHWGGDLSGQRAHQSRPRPALQDAGLQGLRGQPAADRVARRLPPAFPAAGPHRATPPTPDPRSTNCSSRPVERTSPCSPRTVSSKASTPSRAPVSTSRRRSAPSSATWCPTG